MPDQDATLDPPPNLDKLVDEARPELETIEDDALVRRAVTRERVLELSTIMCESYKQIAGRLELELSKQRATERHAQLARVEDRAWVFYATDLAAGELHADTIRAERDKLYATVLEHDDTLMLWAVPLFSKDPMHAETLRDIARGHGRRDTADDVLRLVSLYKHNPERAKKQGVVTPAMLEQAHADATRLLDLLRPHAGNPARKLAMQAFTAWFRDYDDLRQTALYIARGEADLQRRFPGVFTERSRSTPTGGGGSGGGGSEEGSGAGPSGGGSE